MFEVVKPFRGDRPYEPGEIVDATGWRLVRQLVAQRYLRECHGETPDTGRGRKKVTHA